MEFEFERGHAILEESTVLFTEHEINHAIKKIAAAISQEIQDETPVFLTVMNGGMFFAANLLLHFKFPVICDYIHCSRYGDATFGSTHITWFRQPKLETIKDKNVYIIDDILDEGHTLAEVSRFVKNVGAKSCKLVVLIDKKINKEKPVVADFTGFEAPNKFLFGYGMDIYGLYRNLSEVYIYNS
jgi:hypoxanthine phosphoribosyltransferase